MEADTPLDIKLIWKNIFRKVKFFYYQIAWFLKTYRDYVSLFFIFVVILLYIFFASSPSKFPAGVTVTVEGGSSLTEVAEYLKGKNIIRSPFAFKVLVYIRGGEDGSIAGDYFFSKSRNVFHVSRRIVLGQYGLNPVSITIPEGSTVVDMAVIYERYLSDFDAEEFVDDALPYEGYLFPDTYYFLPSIKTNEIISTMKENFFKRIGEIQEEINSSDKSLEEIVIMASLLEEEARTEEARRMISGVLWHRIDIGMPLQVDAVFPYILGKNTYEVTLADLKIDSPYNTYKYKGLPFGPISNPGLRSLAAAANPIENDNIFYLADMYGNTYYSKTFEEHKRKKRLYIP